MRQSKQNCSEANIKIQSTPAAAATTTTRTAMKKRLRITSRAPKPTAKAKAAAATTTTTTVATTPTTTARGACCLCFRVTSAMWHSAWLPLQLLLALTIFALFGAGSAVGYSYARFEGPVAGPERLVTVADSYGGGTHSDYVARPEYSFAYGIEDGEARVLQNRKETRNGDEVRGVYSVVDPDGTLRVVKYTADDANGFQAEVITNGIATLHGHGSEGGGPAQVEQQVAHEPGNELADDADDAEEEGEEHEEEAAPQQGKGQYKVHEDQGEEGDGGEEEEEEGDNEGGGDHEEYEGSSEEGYEDAHTQSKQQDGESSEEY